MHHIYHTEGIILGSRNYGEAGKCFYIFTRELGLVYASAQGVRKLSSKLRFTLQDFSLVTVDLVRGKDFWRVTTASKLNEFENIKNDPAKLRIFVSISRLLRRLLAGEDKNEVLFAEFLQGVLVLGRTEKKEDRESLEVVLVLRILNHLGYIGSLEENHELVTSPFEQEVVLKASKNRAKILHTINQALRETHL